MQRVTQLQLGLMFVLFHFSTATGFLMGLIFPTADYQGWLVILTAFAGGLLITYISFALAKRRPSEFLVHYGKELVGRWLHIILMIGFGFFFLFILPAWCCGRSRISLSRCICRRHRRGWSPACSLLSFQSP